MTNGVLALGPNGSINTSSQIIPIGSGIFDVSQVSGGYTLPSAKTIAGSGTVAGNVTQASGSIVNPSAATLTFANDLIEQGGAVNHFDLSIDPLSPTNDFINVAGTLNLSGVNTIEIVGTLSPFSVYPLIAYGTLSGDLSNFAGLGATGNLSNNPTTKIIYLVTGAPIRSPTDVVWAGSATANIWDTLNHTNWLNSGNIDYFVSGDNALFDDTGVTHPLVNIPGNVIPSSVVVGSAGNYTFTGTGQIGGGGALVKTNSGTLTVLTTNSFTGPTIIAGGALEASTLAPAGVNSSIGAATLNPTNLVIDAATLRYTGGSVTTDRGATINSGGAAIEVTLSGTTLTLSSAIGGAGLLAKTGPGALTLSVDNSYAGGTVISNGTLRVNSGVSLGTGGFTNYGSTFRLNTSTAVGNIVEFNGACTLDLGNVSGNQVLDGAWSGNGTVNIISQQNATRVFTMGGNGAGGGNMNGFTGTVNIGTNSGTFRFNDGGGAFNLGSSNMVLDLGTSTAIFYNRNRGTVNLLGALAGGSSTLLTNGTDNSGTTTYVVGGRNTDSTFAGTIGSASGASIALVKTGIGRLTLSGADNYTGATTISNGVLALSGTGTIFRTPTISVLTNTVLDVSGRVDGTLTLNSGQTLQGSGTVRGSVTAGSGAFVTVGDDASVPEALTITNALLLQSGSTLNMDLDHYQFFGGLTNDVIQGLASVTYGGTLNLNISSIETNSVFKLFSAGSYSGSFSSIVPATPPPPLTGKAWDTSFLTVDGTLRITIQRPNFTTIVPSGTDLIISGANGIPGAEYHVLVSTNVALPVAQWTSIATNFFGGTDFQFTLSNAIDPNTPQQFYLLQVITP